MTTVTRSFRSALSSVFGVIGTAAHVADAALSTIDKSVDALDAKVDYMHAHATDDADIRLEQSLTIKRTIRDQDYVTTLLEVERNANQDPEYAERMKQVMAANKATREARKSA